jgi:hypothetical protein
VIWVAVMPTPPALPGLTSVTGVTVGLTVRRNSADTFAHSAGSALDGAAIDAAGANAPAAITAIITAAPGKALLNCIMSAA